MAKISNVKAKIPPLAASNTVGLIAEGKILGKKYPAMVAKATAFDKS